jgi:hypothetical protein
MLFLHLAGTAQGNLLIVPKRIVFEGATRYGELHLANTGSDTARYTISLIHYRMKEDGTLEELQGNDSAILFADAFVRFFPRSVVLAPNESQTVRIQLTQTDKLKQGEYRSHLYFRAVANEKPLGEVAIKKKDSAAITISLKPVFGISVPVIVRSGASTTQVGIAHCAFVASATPYVKMTLLREGNMSFYGDISIDHIAIDGSVTRVAELKGSAVYTPLHQRQVNVSLNLQKGVDYSKGKLHIVYKAQENLNQTSIAQTEILLN